MPGRSAYDLPHPEPVHRGVHIAPWTDQGRRIAVAVDRFGRRVAKAIIEDPDEAVAVIRHLWAMLDDADPPCGRNRRLRLHR